MVWQTLRHGSNRVIFNSTGERLVLYIIMISVIADTAGRTRALECGRPKMRLKMRLHPEMCPLSATAYLWKTLYIILFSIEIALLRAAWYALKCAHHLRPEIPLHLEIRSLSAAAYFWKLLHMSLFSIEITLMRAALNWHFSCQWLALCLCWIKLIDSSENVYGDIWSGNQ